MSPVLLTSWLQIGGSNKSLKLRIPITNPSYFLYFWPSCCRSEVPMTPSLGLINLLEELTELRKSFYSLDYWFTIKGCNSRTSGWKRCIGQDMGKGQSFHAFLSILLFPNLHVFINMETLWTQSFWVFMKALLQRYDWLNHLSSAID